MLTHEAQEVNRESNNYSLLAKFYSVEEVAKILTVSARTVWRLVARGVIKAPVKIGKLTKFFREDIDNYVKSLKPIKA